MRRVTGDGGKLWPVGEGAAEKGERLRNSPGAATATRYALDSRTAATAATSSAWMSPEISPPRSISISL